MSNIENKLQAPRILDENEIAAVSGGTDTETDPDTEETQNNRLKTSDKHVKTTLDTY